jgi:RHS repeat-associated protein
VAYNEFDPYGVPVQNGGEPYGYTGEWWEADVSLLYLRARWYRPETGTFLSVDAVETEPPYQYVGGNPVNRVDPSGYLPSKSGIDQSNEYSCDCGWIDWRHVEWVQGWGTELIEAVRYAGTKC